MRAWETERMAETQNLTLRLPRTTLRRARIAAAHLGTSISALIVDKIEELAGEDDAYETARRRAVQALDAGFRLGGRRVARGALHGR
jgi:hypothetical protein